MFLFPALYIFFFFAALYQLFKGRQDGFLLFVIFGLPMYITALSVAFMFGLKAFIPLMQSFKEVVIGFTLLAVVLSLRKKPKLRTGDWLVILFGAYSLSYVLLPGTGFSIMEKLLSFKSFSFFPFIYFTGRLIDPDEINLNKQFTYMCIVAMAAALVVLVEVITYTHFQTISGYADYMFYYFDQDPAGHYGLSWTFEIEDGLKRFASIFANPLDHAAGTLVSLSAIAALITTDTKKIRINNFVMIAFVATVASVIFALSRASFISYFTMLYAYFFIAKQRQWLRATNYTILTLLAIGLIWINGDLYSFIVNTITFSNSSSASHIVDWLAAINAMITHPLGMGLGAAGRIGTVLKINEGGENELLIIGVQVGILPVILYTWLYVYIIRTAGWVYRNATGKAKKLAIFVLLLRIGLIIPMLSAEAESYVYVSYVCWFFSALLINIKYKIDEDRRRYQGSQAGAHGSENDDGGTMQAIPPAGN